MADIDDIIAGGGLVFKSAPKGDPNAGKIKTKAKKKKYLEKSKLISTDLQKLII